MAILEDRWWPQTAMQEEDQDNQTLFSSMYGRIVLFVQMLEVSLL